MVIWLLTNILSLRFVAKCLYNLKEPCVSPKINILKAKQMTE